MKKVSPYINTIEFEKKSDSISSSREIKECQRPSIIKIPSSNKINGIFVKRSSNKIIEDKSCYSHICEGLPLICKNLKLKMEDHLLLGGEHNKKMSPGFSTPINGLKEDILSEEKTEIVLEDPKFGMFSLFKYHLRKGYMNTELKKSNKVYCSHIFSLLFALPIIVFISQWVLYTSLLVHEINVFDGNYCPNTSSFENKLMMCGIGLIYFVRSFFIWDNLTTRIGLKKMHRVDSISVILDTFQEFLFNIIVYAANLWIIFAEDDIQNMILNSLAMEFLMTLDNEFEELYFKYLPGAAEDIYDTMYVSYEDNKELVKKKQKNNKCFRFVSSLLFVPYKLLLATIFVFPLVCFFITIVGPICK
jgi:hypothetical protein